MRLRLILPAILGASFGAAAPQAQTVPSAREIEERAAGKEAERTRREDALRDTERRARDSVESRRRLADEVATLKTDGARLAEALVAAGRRAQAAEARILSLEASLDTSLAREATIKTSLEARKDLVTEVLAALQRMKLRGAPPILTEAADIVAAIRSAAMLGAMLPGLRAEVAALTADLAELVRLQALALRDRGALEDEVRALAGERDRLAALTEARREQLSRLEGDLSRERLRSDALGQEARSLRELVERLEAEIASARRSAEEARRAAQAEIREVRDRFAAAALREPPLLVPKVPFEDARGLLGRPVAGQISRDFGNSDGAGGAMRGIVIAARPRSIVTSPADGRVVYAGPFRSFGRLLIIDAGGGYYLLLAGMGQISVEPGQFVLAGEPVGQTGDGPPSAALGAVEGSGSGLYVEFRKDGGPIDPGPWWLRSQGEKVRG